MKQFRLIASGLIMTALLLGACQPEVVEVIKEVAVEKIVEVEVDKGSSNPSLDADPDKTPVTLNFLALADDDQLNAWREQLAEFQTIDGGKWSYVDLQFETIPFRELFPKIEASVAAGLPWDLYQADGPDMKHYGFNRVIYDMNDLFTAEEKAQWFPQSVEEGSFRGRLLGPPILQSCSLMMYNKDMTDAAGINPPAALADSWTMDEAMDAWVKTTLDEDGDDVPDQWGVRWGQGTWTGDYEAGIFRRSNGVKGSDTWKGMGDDGVTFKGYLNSEESIEAHQFYQDMHQKQKITPVEAIPEIFESRISAFMITPDNRIGALNRIHGEGNFNWGVTGIPYFKTSVCHTGSWHYGISPNTDNLAEAVAFVKYASSDDGARIFYKYVRQLPANIGLFNELPEYAEGGSQRMWLDAMNAFGVPRIGTPGYTEYQQMMSEALQNIAAGGNPKEILDATAGRIEGLLAKYTGWNN